MELVSGVHKTWIWPVSFGQSESGVHREGENREQRLR